MTEERTTSSTGGQKGVKLARFDLIPTGPLKALAEHFGRGALKYDDNQWRKGYEWSKSYAAGMRHWTLFWGGEDYDVCPKNEEGCAFVDQHGESFPAFDTPRGRGCYNHTTSHHLACVAWHAFVGLEFFENNPEHDDRYRPSVPEPTEEPLRPSRNDINRMARMAEWFVVPDLDRPVLLLGEFQVSPNGEITQAVHDALNRRD